MFLNKERIASWLETWKPVAPLRVHILLATLMWTIAGLYLFVQGASNMLSLSRDMHTTCLIVAGLVGVLKSWLIFDRTAVRIISRIEGMDRNKCAGGFLSLRNWGMIILMIFLGMSLRASPLPRVLVWGVYVAVGTGLFLSSRLLWKELIKWEHSV